VRVEQVAGQLRVQPDVARVVSFYETRDPAMVSRDRHSTYVVAYFKPRSDTQLEDAAQRIEDHFAGQRDVRLGGEQIAGAQANTQVGNDLVHAGLLAFPFIPCCRCCSSARSSPP
jgi:trehalose monomycolate/heme transporter